MPRIEGNPAGVGLRSGVLVEVTVLAVTTAEPGTP